MSHIIVFGASNTAGHWDESGGWVARLSQKVNERVIASNFVLYDDFYNLSVSGDTSRDVLARFDHELKPRLDEEEATIIIFDFGTNDSAFNNDTKQNQIPAAEFETNLKTVLAQAKKYTDRIIFVGLTPVDEAKVDPIPWHPPYSYLNKEITKFDQTISRVVKGEKATFLDLFDRMVNQTKDYLTADGVHLNTNGHKYIFETVWPKLEQLLK